MSTTETHAPALLAGSLIAIPVVFFALAWMVGPFSHFSVYLLMAWTIAALATAASFTFDRRFMDQFSTSERFAILAGNGLVGLLVATTGFLAFAA